MKPELYEQFVKLKSVGKKDEARIAVRDFIASFESLDEKRAWTKHFLENEQRGHKIRHELYEHVVHPVLLDGYRHDDAWSLLWLVRTSQYFSDGIKKTPYELLKKCYALQPDEDVRCDLIRMNVRWFEYSQHEWPAGILYGHDGATSEECDELLREVAWTRTLDLEGELTSFLDDYEDKVRQYLARLQERQPK